MSEAMLWGAVVVWAAGWWVFHRVVVGMAQGAADAARSAGRDGDSQGALSVLMLLGQLDMMARHAWAWPVMLVVLVWELGTGWFRGEVE